MRIRGLTLPLLLLGLVAGCGRSAGDIAVSWSFAGGSCLDAGIDQVQVTVDGASLDQNVFDCASNSVVLKDFRPGSYLVRVDGLGPDANGTTVTRWSGSATARVDGNAVVKVVLQPLSADSAVAYFAWRFDASSGQAPQCGQNGRLDGVAIFIDDQDSGTYQCEQGNAAASATAQVITPFVTPGNHTVYFVAYDTKDTANPVAFAQTDPITVNFQTGKTSAQTVSLHWNVGGLVATWIPYQTKADYLADRRAPCSAQGITDVQLGFQGPGGTQTIDVGAACAGQLVLDNVFAGASLVPIADEVGPGNAVVYRESPNVPATPDRVQVVAGRFWDGSSQAFQLFLPLFPPGV